MKKSLLLSLLLLTSCHHNSESVWDDNSTTGNYINKAKSLFWQPYSESRAIANADDFAGPTEDEFIPLKDSDLKTQIADFPQAKAEPGSKESALPGIQGFKNPTGNLASIFQLVYFNTDDHVLRSREQYEIVKRMSDYMKKHPNLFVFVTGHCDERASEAYNLALGTRRANFVRSQMIKQGVAPSRIFTISYGKEMPADAGHTREAWSKNRRCEFKIYEKPTIVQR